MGAILDALHRLQEVELQIAEINRVIQRKVSAVKKQQQRITEIDAKISTQQLSLRTDQMEADRLDLDVKSREAEIAKLRGALNLAKTNKEYSAVLTQLNTTKADNGKNEESVLIKLTALDGKRKLITGLQEERQTEVNRLEEFKTAQSEAENKSRDRLKSLLTARKKAEADVPAAALDRFRRVADKNEGEAMAVIIRTHPKREEYSCGGCNMSITIEQVNAVMSRDEAVLCNVCGKILYLESIPAGAR
jgi:predicted  nucleic acid-binding Zn-ribbon protein